MRFNLLNMALHQWFCFVLIASVFGVTQAQCIIRTLFPMAMMDSSCSTGSCSVDDSSTDDLNALLLLARALELDRANNANNGIDVNGLLNNLINALVVTATNNGGRSDYPSPYDNFWTGTSPGYPSSPSFGGSKKNDDALLDLQLFGPGKDNIAALDLSGDKLLGVGVGANGNNDNNAGSSAPDSSGLSGVLGGVTGAVSGVTGTVGGVTGAVGGVTGAVSGVTSTVSGVTGAVGGLTGGLGGGSSGGGLLSDLNL